MPRGGKRPGAGAPRGNFNAVTRGNNSERLIAVYVLATLHPDQHALAHELIDARVITRPPRPSRVAMRLAVTYIWNTYFDRSAARQSITIKQPVSSPARLPKTKNCRSNSGAKRPDLAGARLRERTEHAVAALVKQQIENRGSNQTRFSATSIAFCRRCSAARDAPATQPPSVWRRS
jgi:hypothetical protein